MFVSLEEMKSFCRLADLYEKHGFISSFRFDEEVVKFVVEFPYKKWDDVMLLYGGCVRESFRYDTILGYVVEIPNSLPDDDDWCKLIVAVKLENFGF